MVGYLPINESEIGCMEGGLVENGLPENRWALEMRSFVYFQAQYAGDLRRWLPQAKVSNITVRNFA